MHYQTYHYQCPRENVKSPLIITLSVLRLDEGWVTSLKEEQWRM